MISSFKKNYFRLLKDLFINYNRPWINSFMSFKWVLDLLQNTLHWKNAIACFSLHFFTHCLITSSLTRRGTLVINSTISFIFSSPIYKALVKNWNKVLFHCILKISHLAFWVIDLSFILLWINRICLNISFTFWVTLRIKHFYW